MMGRRTPNKVRMMEGEDVRTAVRVHLSKTVCMCAVAGKGYKEHPAIETNVPKITTHGQYCILGSSLTRSIFVKKIEAI